MRLSILLGAIVLCHAQVPIVPPDIGRIIDASGSIWPLYGLAGNFMAGPRERVRVISNACSESLCLAKTAHRILSVKSSVRAPAGPALFGLDGVEALVYFPESDLFARWQDGRLIRLPWRVQGEVLSLRAGAIAVRRGTEVWIVRPDGAILDYLGEASGPVLLLDDAALLSTGDELILRREGGESRFKLSGIQELSRLGSEYVQVSTATASYALRTTSGREDLLLLPAPPSPATSGSRVR